MFTIFEYSFQAINVAIESIFEDLLPSDIVLAHYIIVRKLFDSIFNTRCESELSRDIKHTRHFFDVIAN